MSLPQHRHLDTSAAVQQTYMALHQLQPPRTPLHPSRLTHQRQQQHPSRLNTRLKRIRLLLLLQSTQRHQEHTRFYLLQALTRLIPLQHWQQHQALWAALQQALTHQLLRQVPHPLRPSHLCLQHQGPQGQQQQQQGQEPRHLGLRQQGVQVGWGCFESLAA